MSVLNANFFVFSLIFLNVWVVFCAGWIEIASNETTLLPISRTLITNGPFFGNISYYAENYTLYQSYLTEGWDWYSHRLDSSNESPIQNQSILIFKPCPTKFVYYSGWGVWNSIPSPQVEWNGNQWNVTVSYARENLTYQIDLCEPSNSISTCQTKRNTNLFQSSPTATFPFALNNPTFDAYDHSNAIWDLKYINCSHIQYSTKNWNLSTQLYCQSNSQYCVNMTVVANTPFVEYSGALKIYVYQNRHLLQRWDWPFVYRYNVYPTVLSNQQMQSHFQPLVSIQIAQDGKLKIGIKTTTKDPSKYLSDARYDSSLQLQSLPSNSREQMWEFSSQSIQSIYQQIYSFSWILKPDDILVSFQVSVSLIRQTPTQQQYTLNTELKAYRNENFTLPTSGPFSTQETIYFASIYQGTDFIFDMSLLDAWVCYPKYPDLIPEYNPEKNLYGCALPSPSIPSENILQIYKQGNPVNDTRYQVVFYPHLILGGKKAVGFSLQFTSSFVEEKILYMHVNTKLFPKPFKRIYLSKANQEKQFLNNDFEEPKTASDLIAFYVKERQDPLKKMESIQHQLTVLYIVLALVIAFAVVVIVSLILLCTMYQKRQKQQIVQKEWNRLSKKHNEFLSSMAREKVQEKAHSKIETIDDILTNPVFYTVFETFCEKEKKKENIMFCLAVNQFNSISNPDEKNQEYTSIYHKYIKKNAVYELNISDSLRVENVTHLDSILFSVKLDLQHNTLHRFLSQLRDKNNTWIQHLNPEQAIQILKH